MKNTTMRKLAGIAAIVTLASCTMASMGMTAFATGSETPTTSITITNAVANSKYDAYRLLNVTQSGTNYSYTINEDYREVLEAVTQKTADTDIIEYIEGLTAAADIRDFADAVYAQVKGMGADAAISGTTAATVAQGYYLVAETAIGDDGTYSLVMLDTAGTSELEIETKENTPTLEKKIKDINDSEEDAEYTDWQDGADYDIGDDIPFQLTGTVSSYYGDYAEYYYAFHDTLSAGLTFNNDVKVYVDDVEITQGFTVVTPATDGCSFDVVFENLKDIGSVTGASKIVVEYTAKLNENATVGLAGNTNVADLEYSTNPYFEGVGDTDNDGKDEDEDGNEEETGVTPEDKVIAFTYKTIINKVDSSGIALNGAAFALYKKNSEGAWVLVDEYDKGTDETPVTTFEFVGLDDGDYKLEETAIPAGFNGIKPIEFTITAEHDTDSEDPKFISLSSSDDGITYVAKDAEDNTVDALVGDIENKSGSELPSTGGIGTTLFYVIGGTMVAGAGVYLISKKRMNNKED